MESGLDKIICYFDEVKRVWQTSPEKASSRAFYELWETVHEPRPFSFSSDHIELFGKKYKSPEVGVSCIGYFAWQDSENCASLIAEGESMVKKFLLNFDDKGEPKVVEFAPEPYDDDIEHGKKLELVYDVIAHIRRNSPGKDILNLSKKEFCAVLDTLEGHHEARFVKGIRKLQASAIKELIKTAAEDMASDELSDQLSLPLDGSYALLPSEDDASDDEKDSLPAEAVIPSRTLWAVLNEVDFLSKACRMAAEYEKKFVLAFKGCAVLGERRGHELPVKLFADPDYPLMEGDVLSVFHYGESEQGGTFTIDLYDGNTVYGRLIWDGPEKLDNLFARPRKSPSEYLANSVEELLLRIKNGAPGSRGVLDEVLGLKSAKFRSSPENGKAPEKLDPSQKVAWQCATDAANPVILIQGPPGTGKTTVLEHVLRALCINGLRVLVTAPSNTAVDNICRRVSDLPLLRFGKIRDNIAPDVSDRFWIGDVKNIHRFTELRNNSGRGGVYAGTHVGLMRDSLVQEDMDTNGLYDVVVFDEAGMAKAEEFFLCAAMGKRVLLFGDHQQLPPFPFPKKVIDSLREEYGAISKPMWSLTNESALEWLVKDRKFPVIMLKHSYRCQNPRLLRFSSTLFYNAEVKSSESAEYFKLPFAERRRKYPMTNLRLFRTSGLPEEMKREKLVFEGDKPGIENPVEARLCCEILYRMLKKYPLDEITIIAPYRRQIKLIRRMLSIAAAGKALQRYISDDEWKKFVYTRISTVDSFQGGESDAVIISYVRSNDKEGIGFVDDPNRVNVAHTRCRKEMVIIGDIECLKKQAVNNIFERMERAFDRDGVIIDVTLEMLKEQEERIHPPPNPSHHHSKPFNKYKKKNFRVRQY